ncbi:MAG: 3-phosphoglycerate dehydrogenase [Clostridia bacterium]|nr:3-phosphoglycerate dehydrogenase [Clostridia bacterium]
MFKIRTLNEISPFGLEKFDKANYEISSDFENPDAIILRSFKMHDMELPASLKAVARAGAGVNNIPIDKCSEKGIVVFNTPGANANAVKELALAALLFSSRNIFGGVEWAKTLDGKGDEIPGLTEKGKSSFAGPEIKGKKLGVIGLGAIGVMVANSAYHLGMDVVGYDPYISIDAAWSISRHVEKVTDLNELVAKCDYISLHVPLNDATRGMIGADLIANMKPGMRVLNFSRGELVDDNAMRAALDEGKVACYVTDFPNKEVLTMKNAIVVPHLGASTPESEDNCAVMAAKQLKDYLENGNVKNSVNFPECVMPRSAKNRIVIAHKNVQNMISTFTTELASANINIENLLNKSKKDLAITLIDTDNDIPESAVATLEATENVLHVTVLN